MENVGGRSITTYQSNEKRCRKMTEFDNWNSKQKRIVPSNTGRFHTLVDSERKRAWKAALEWALTTQGQIDWRFNPVILPKYIEEELNAKT